MAVTRPLAEPRRKARLSRYAHYGVCRKQSTVRCIPRWNPGLELRTTVMAVRASLSAGSIIFAEPTEAGWANAASASARRASTPREPHRKEIRMRALLLATPRPIVGLLLTAAIHRACGLDSGRYFHGDITDCSLTR
jgi:hypothetical protein